uniref:Family with sequence similarity 219 member Aa n=1 Tax=Cyprinus carpio TaxID=7962 RepID=A0A8C1PZ96_CYPCA
MEGFSRFDPAATSTLEAETGTRESESVAINYKPSPLQVKIEKQRELARKASVKNGTVGSPVNQQPKKNNVMARTRLVVPNKGYSSLDQSPDEKPLVALDTDSMCSAIIAWLLFSSDDQAQHAAFHTDGSLNLILSVLPAVCWFSETSAACSCD